jgi:hypothetical protein
VPLTPEESLQAVKSVQPQIDANKKRERDELDEDQRELAMLARRRREAFVRVALDPEHPDQTIRIRTGLTAAEVEEVGTMLAEAERLTMEGRDDQADLLVFQVVEICTPNKAITAGWLQEHPDEYPVNDVKTAVRHIYKEYLETLVRLQQARRFRHEANGPGAGGDDALVERNA